ncbi:hypothetical protein [Henriciella marina]|uniref:BON domain-containing protein n=1 Tax=Henriciella marina TaxID=453851 RepID=A0ABT4LQD8_9PROT|nr:hypothetical protein [Henriciella marina]MCZ4296576.1 hypothetical protein [Henriciella marina]
MQTAAPTPAPAMHASFSGPSYTFADGQVVLSGTIRNQQDAKQLVSFINAVTPMLKAAEPEEPSE